VSDYDDGYEAGHEDGWNEGYEQAVKDVGPGPTFPSGSTNVTAYALSSVPLVTATAPLTGSV